MVLISEAMQQRALRVRPSPAIEEHIAKALGNSLRVQILWILNERVASPSELSKELGVALNRVCNHLKVLREADCVELVKEEIVGNSVQRFYQATARVFLDDTEWPDVPASVQKGLRTTLLHNLIDDAIEAVSRGTYDALEGSHMSWTPMILDEQGRLELIDLLERSLVGALGIQENAQKRLSASNMTGISYSVSMLGYPSIGGKKKVVPTKGKKLLTKPAKGSKSKAKKTATKKTKAAGKNQTAKRKRKSPGK